MSLEETSTSASSTVNSIHVHASMTLDAATGVPFKALS